MYWQEDDKKNDITTSEKVVDLNYKIDCKQIPTRHAWELSQALYQALPWMKNEAEVGVHQIHGATSGNGWERPSDGELIHLSKRTRMHLRVPVERVDDAKQLVGKKLDVADHTVCVGKMTSKSIDPFSTIFARYIVMQKGMSEDDFLQWIVGVLSERNIQARKLLCGMQHAFKANGELIETRSLMIADLDKIFFSKVTGKPVSACTDTWVVAFFVAHKGIKAVGETEDKAHFSGG